MNQDLIVCKLALMVSWSGTMCDVHIKQCQSKDPEIAAITPKIVYRATEGLASSAA